MSKLLLRCAYLADTLALIEARSGTMCSDECAQADTFAFNEARSGT